MSKEALIIVDVQNDFCSGSLPVPHGEEVIDPINNLVAAACKNHKVVVFTRDWHPRNTIHFDKWPPHCIQGTFGAQFVETLGLEGGVIFSKGMGENEDSYSGFDSLDEKQQTLDSFLQDKQVGEVYVAGLALDYCVKQTALSAKDLGYDTYLILDATKAVNLNPHDGEEAINEMEKKGIIIFNSQEVIKKMEESPPRDLKA